MSSTFYSLISPDLHQSHRNLIYFPDNKRFTAQQKKIVAILLAAVIVAGVVAIFIVFDRQNKSERERAAVVTNGIECSELAGQILRDGGSAADAAITALLCEGVTCPQSTGIGGGFVMTLYSRQTGKVETLIARERAPGKASKDMFQNDTKVEGIRSVAVPGEIKGYWELHQKYGKLEWKKLFKPVIDLCRRGHVVSRYLALILNRNKKVIENSPSLAEIYIDPNTKDVYQIGQYVKRLELAKSLELVAEEGAATLYENGTLANKLIDDIQKAGGIITTEDLMAYKVRWEEPITQQLVDNKMLHTFPLPGTGPMIVFIANVLNGQLTEGPTIQSMHRIAETFKYAYAQRTELGDTAEAQNVVKNLTDANFAKLIRSLINDTQTSNDFKHYFIKSMNKEDHGTAHVNILAENGDAISVTGSINTLFGSKIRSKQTGIILNDSMDDFSLPGRPNSYGLPPSKENFIAPSKMPLSSMSPTILLDKNGDVELLIGGAGGSKITSSVAYVLLRYLYFKEDLNTAIMAPRIHHQLLPMQIEYEQKLDNSLIHGLEKLGHKMVQGPVDYGFASLTAIGRKGHKLIPVYDPRRLGSSTVY